MPEIFLIGHGFMLYDNIGEGRTATRTFEKPPNVDIVFYIEEDTSAYGANILVAVSRNVDHKDDGPIADRVQGMNLDAQFEPAEITPSTATNCVAILAPADAPNHLLTMSTGSSWEVEYARVLQQWQKPLDWHVKTAADFPTCRAKYLESEGASLSSIALFCARTYPSTVLHWLVCRAPMQTNPVLPPESPLRGRVKKVGRSQVTRDKVDLRQKVSQKAKDLGQLLKAVHQYQALGQRWLDFELKYFVISNLSVQILGGGEAMRDAGRLLFTDTTDALRQTRNDIDLMKHLGKQVDPKMVRILDEVDRLDLLLQQL